MFHFRDQEMNEGINISYILSYSDTKSVQNITRNNKYCDQISLLLMIIIFILKVRDIIDNMLTDFPLPHIYIL